MSETSFLALDEVLAIHRDLVVRYGGAEGVRDLAGLESALAMPRAGFGEDLMHPTVPEQASAYLFHLVKNHPFLDGNKRTGLAVALVFLGLNELRLEAGIDELEGLVVGVADGSVEKAQVAVFLAERVVEAPGG